MPIQHIIQQGESIVSLSEDYGQFALTIWNDPANAALKQKRKNMDILMPGDVVVIPDKRIKKLSKPQEKKHRFRRKGIPAIIRLQLFDADLPRKNQSYVLTVDGKLFKGTTDGDGILEQFVPAKSREATLTIGPENSQFKILLGHLDPIDEISGVQRRLNNLGFDCGEPTGILNDDTVEALKAFQQRFGLDVTGQADQATRDKIQNLHDHPSSMAASNP